MPRHSDATLAAIKNVVDIVTLVGEYLPLHRSGSKFKALCPFHDDHNPSLEINPERQSFKCWSCGAGGDVFDFVKDYEKVEFPEALRMLAERAGIALESPSDGPVAKGPSKSELLAVNTWAEGVFAEALGRAPEVLAYVKERGISSESVARFHLGYAPDARDWLSTRARKPGHSTALLERAGLIARSATNPGLTRDRFRGRLMFPIHDPRGRALGFGGRILPSVERLLVAEGKNVAKYLNSPETPVFQKRRVLYAADLARTAAREAGWVAVVEGYTDVIAAHQVGLANVVGTLGTALGDDHVAALRRLADRVVLIFDGDEAGQSAADRALELFLGHELDVRVLTLPEKLDPCDFLLKEGAEAFRALADRAVDPLDFAIGRAEARFDLDSVEDSRRAAEWVLSVMSRVPAAHRYGLDLKVARALDKLSRRLRVPVEALDRRLRQLRQDTKRAGRFEVPDPAAAATQSEAGSNAREERPLKVPPIKTSSLDPTDRELIEIILNEPSVVSRIITRVAVASICDAPLRTILQACYDLYGEGRATTFERVVLRLDDPGVKALAASLLLPFDPVRLPEVPGCGPNDSVRPGPLHDRLTGVLANLAERERQVRIRDLSKALKDVDPVADPEAYRALQIEFYRIQQQPGTKTKHAS